MSIQQNAPNISIVAGATLTPYLLITQAGTLCAVSVTRTHVGVTQEAAASGKPVTVRLPHAGTAKMVASVAISAGARVFYAAGGKTGTTSASNTAVGAAHEAASGYGSIIEVLPD